MAESNLQKWNGGAVGAGLLLVFLPSVALYAGVPWINDYPTVGLPLLAIFGIMILIGALALTSTLFARLGLDNPAEALALPTGSIRAAIALALIVLFAIISIMLFQTLVDGPRRNPVRLTQLQQSDFAAVLKESGNRILAVQAVPCVSASSAGPGAAPSCYTVDLVKGTSQEAIDVAKQLLTLIGTLMTAVTSFYFAARSASPPKAPETAGDPNVDPKVGAEQRNDPNRPADATVAPSQLNGQSGGHVHAQSAVAQDEDGCDAEITDPTPDEALPPAKGGVA